MAGSSPPLRTTQPHAPRPFQTRASSNRLPRKTCWRNREETTQGWEVRKGRGSLGCRCRGREFPTRAPKTPRNWRLRNWPPALPSSPAATLHRSFQRLRPVGSSPQWRDGHYPGCTVGGRLPLLDEMEQVGRLKLQGPTQIHRQRLYGVGRSGVDA